MVNEHIEIRDFSVCYGKECALKNVNLKIPNNAITVILGPSGCGKSTLLKSLNRLIDEVEDVRVVGEIIVDGKNIYDKDINLPELRKKMGLLLQKPQVLPFSIYKNVIFGPKLNGIKDKKKLKEMAQKYLTMAHLWEEVKDRIYEPAHKLSIGQQQRLCLARGLAVEPEILLCDEPTSALDPLSSKKVEETLLELKKDYTIILVTHILRQAKRLGDFIAFFYLGELVEFAPAREFFENPKDERTRAYIKGEIS